MTSAAAIAISACARICRSSALLVSGSMPPVSTSVRTRPFHSTSAEMRSRVTPGVSSTIEMRSPVSLLKNVLFPTFGRPTTATMPFAIARSLSFPYSSASIARSSSPPVGPATVTAAPSASESCGSVVSSRNRSPSARSIQDGRINRP